MKINDASLESLGLEPMFKDPNEDSVYRTVLRKVRTCVEDPDADIVLFSKPEDGISRVFALVAHNPGGPSAVVSHGSSLAIYEVLL